MDADTRKAVVELLRETADKHRGIADAYSRLYGVDVRPEAHQVNHDWRGQHPIWDLAVKSRQAVDECWQDWSTEGYPSYEASCRQAADLLEDGWAP